jgi:predicted amidohydrolase
MRSKKLQEMIGQASWSGAKLVVAPETALGELAKIKEDGVDRKSEMIRLAKDNSVYLCTSFYSKEKGKIYNQGYIVDDDGKILLEHKKIYLAPPEKEEGVSAGDSIKVAETKIGRLGMLICKDGFTKYSHFLYQKFNELGVEIICAPTWSIGWKNTVGNDEYVKALYSYGSFISRSYILMSGNLNKSTESFGRSLVVSPVTGVLKEGSKDKKEILLEELDLDEVKRIREFDSWWQPKTKVELK